MSKSSCSFFIGRRTVFACLIFIPSVFLQVPENANAQRFSLSLADFAELHTEGPWDTVKAPVLDRVILGGHHRLPHFLTWEPKRERKVEEFSLYAPLKVTIRHPNHHRFGFDEIRDGAFIVYNPRDLSIPDLSIDIVFIDDLAEQRRRESFHEVWRSTVVTSINTQAKTTAERRGLLNIDIPVSFPSAVERIIGRGEETNIDISGRQSITFAGESRRVDPFIGAEGQQKQPLFPSLDLRQELDVRLQGQIGEKINIQVDHSSSSVLQEENRIRLNYQGFEDDIVQLVEMGNTSLSLPGSQLVSFSTSAQGLFGIKALGKVGPMDITAIASKEEGELSRATFTPRGGTIGQTEVRTINDVDFVKNIYFFLDHPPDDSTSISVFRRPTEGSVEIFESVDPFEIVANPELVTFFGRAWVDSLGDGADIRDALNRLRQGDPATPPFVEGQYRLLREGEDYRFVLDASDNSVVGVEMNRAVSNTKVLAVRYVNEFGDTVGNFNDFADTLALELIKPFGARPDNEFGYTWAYMMRHIYSLQLSNIDPSTLSIEILDFRPRLDRSVPEGSSVPWIRVFGLDRTDQRGVGPPDNQVDITRNLIDFQRGILTFPIFSPFNVPDDSVRVWTGGQFAFTGVYENIRRPEIYNQFLTDIISAPRFQIVVRAASTTRTFNINAFNISELSEVVRLDGRELARNRDYTINYDTGEVELRGAVLDELTPSSNITIDYEFKPFAGGGSSSLVGFNSLLTLSENAKFGTTWLYESKASATNRPRLGEEPTRAVVGDLNTSLQYNPDFLTDLVNKLPLVDTDARSSVSFVGEVAVSFPDPNTLGEVYIDDFEGIEDSDQISLLRRSWSPASPPVDSAGTGTLDSSKRQRIMWYNIEPDRAVTRRDLNPDLDERESTLVQSLDIEFDSLGTDTTLWAGVMSGFRGGGLDLTQGQFIEVWVNDFKADSERGGILRIDLGSIDEDFYRPDVTPPRFDTEDKARDGFVALTDDTGLDGAFNGNPGDDGDEDDFESRRQSDGRFSKINGTEGNFQLDSEDLDGSRQMETTNAYFSYEIDLASEPVIDVDKDFTTPPRSGHEADSWRLYRINLSDHVRVTKDGTPSFGQIRHIRIWLDNIRKAVNPQFRRVQIAGLKVVGNRWERDGVRTLSDSLVAGVDTLGVGFSLGVISTKTDPIDYIPPVRPNEQNEIAEKEQSLLVNYDGLPPGQSIRLRKRFAGGGLDLTNYRDLHFFVHTDHFDPSLEYYFQIAVDSLNFYEVTVPLTQANFPARNWTRVAIELADLTNLKFEPADSVVTGRISDAVDKNRGYNTRMIGNPSLFTVRFLYAGLRNRGIQATSGELWINDIFLGNRRRDIDFAERVGATINMGNVLNLSGSFSRTGPDFRGLRQTRGSGADQRNLNLNVKTALGHFIPLFGFSIPVAGNYQRTLLLPKFTPNSDTELREGTLRDSLRTERVVRGFSTTLTRSGSRNPLIRYTFDKLKANFSLSEARSRSPSAADTTLSMSGTVDYSITWGAKRTFRLFRDVRFRYWLNSLNFRMNAARQTGRRYRNVGGTLVADPEFYNATLATSGQANYVPFTSLTTSFRMNIARDVARPNEFLGIDIGTETNRDHSLQANFKPPPVWLVRVFSPDINFSAGYREDSSPNVRRPGDPPGVKNVANTRDTGVKLSFDLGKYFKQLFQRFDLLDEDANRGRPGGQGSRGQAQTDADTTEAVPERQGGADKLVAVRKFGGILSSIRKINATLSQRFQSNYSRIPERPGLLFQLGLTDKSGVSRQDVTYDQAERVNETSTIALDSGAQITRDIDLSARFSATITNTSFRASETRAKNMTWPDINVSWTGIERYGPIQGLFKSTSATVGFRSQTRESGRGDLVETTDKSRTISPTIVFLWKNDINTNLNAQFTKNTSETRGALNETTSMNIGMELKYAFQAGKRVKLPLPFLRNKTLRSSLNTTLQMGYTRSGGKRSVLGSVPQNVPRRTSIRVAPRVNYNFTRALNGGLFVDYNRQYSALTNQTTTTVRVGLDATFTF